MSNFIPVGGLTDPSGNFLASGNYQGAPAASGVNHIVTAQAGKSIYILSYALQAVGTVTAAWQDTTPTSLSPAWTFQAREGISRTAPAGGYLFATAAGKGLDLNLSAGVAVNVELIYAIF